MKDYREFRTALQIEQRMHVVRHDAPAVQPIAVLVKMLQRTGDEFRVVSQKAGAATAVELLVEPKL